MKFIFSHLFPVQLLQRRAVHLPPPLASRRSFRQPNTSAVSTYRIHGRYFDFDGTFFGESSVVDDWDRTTTGWTSATGWHSVATSTLSVNWNASPTGSSSTLAIAHFPCHRYVSFLLHCAKITKCAASSTHNAITGRRFSVRRKMSRKRVDHPRKGIRPSEASAVAWSVFDVSLQVPRLQLGDQMLLFYRTSLLGIEIIRLQRNIYWKP